MVDSPNGISNAGLYKQYKWNISEADAEDDTAIYYRVSGWPSKRGMYFQEIGLLKL